MRWKFTLSLGGTFDEIVNARDFSEAKRIALSRNPGATILWSELISQH
tara:strand:- start:171 stop:314 length:144 start_codon:yes stop_codon:yes gene_type:complete